MYRSTLALGVWWMGCAFLFGLAQSAAAQTELQFLDTFEVVSFANQDGTDAWASDWIEVDADGVGPGTGNVRIIDGTLELDHRPGVGSKPSAARAVDLHSATSATLSFDFSTGAGVDSSDAVAIEISRDGGGEYTEIEIFSGIRGVSSGSRSYDITEFASSMTRIRFRIDQRYGARDEFFRVAEVEITADAPPPGDFQVRDEFETVSYSNQDGMNDWAADWIEDDPAGAGPSLGSVFVGDGGLKLSDGPETGPSAAREVDLTGASQATLSFDFSTTPSVESRDEVTVEASADGGATYVALEVIPGARFFDERRIYDITDFVSDRTRVRFRVSSGYAGANEFFRVEIVEINTGPVPVVAEGLQVLDLFEASSFANQDGRDMWATNWEEDDVAGAGPTAGNAQIKGGALALDDRPNTGTEPGLEREVNLAGLDSAMLHFDFSTTNRVDPSDAATVDVSRDGGDTYTELETFTGISGATAGSRSYDITDFVSDATRVRFRVTNHYGGSKEVFAVEFVEITGEGVRVIEEPKAPPSLATAQIPPVAGLGEFVKSEGSAIELGKALFWDMQVGSDGQACASCHFHAGADRRVKNQLSPGLNHENPALRERFDGTASGGAGGPNYTLVTGDFPFHQFEDPDDRHSPVAFTTDDVASSQGTFGGMFTGVPPESELDDECDRFPDLVFHVNGVGTRKVEPRHTPTVINAVFNFRNFWDGRANNVFNGVDPFGLRNRDARVFERWDAMLRAVKIDLRNSSLASQGVGPPGSDFEMSCSERGFASIGRKLIPRTALAFQAIDPADSVLASLATSPRVYRDLIEGAFHGKWWSSSSTVDGFSQMEANFSLFFGLAVQLYEATLVSDEAPYDRFAAGKSSPFPPDEGDQSALSDAERRGLDIFLDKGRCINCHNGPEFTKAATHLQGENQEEGLVERMRMGDGGIALYDNGFYNIGVTPTEADPGVGAEGPFGNPLSFTGQFAEDELVDPFEVDPCTFEVPFDTDDCSFVPNDLRGERRAVKGAFKVPTLRNVELTGPFFHNGGVASLEQIVEFYNRGGNFHDNPELDPDIRRLRLSDQDKADLVAFLKALTDPRVTDERAPFDHPQLFVPNGHPGDETGIPVVDADGLAGDDLLEILAVGADGRSGKGLPPLRPFDQTLEGGS